MVSRQNSFKFCTLHHFRLSCNLRSHFFLTLRISPTQSPYKREYQFALGYCSLNVHRSLFSATLNPLKPVLVLIFFFQFKENTTLFHYRDQLFNATLYFEIHRKPTSTLCGQNAELLFVKAGSTYILVLRFLLLVFSLQLRLLGMSRIEC
jgi:hypothetical protein